MKKKIKKDLKKVLTNTKGYDNIYKLSRIVSQTNENKSLDLVKIRIARFRFRKPLQKILKNLLTNTKQCDMIIKLTRGSQTERKSSGGWIRDQDFRRKTAEKNLKKPLDKRKTA